MATLRVPVEIHGIALRMASFTLHRTILPAPAGSHGLKSNNLLVTI